MSSTPVKILLKIMIGPSVYIIYIYMEVYMYNMCVCAGTAAKRSFLVGRAKERRVCRQRIYINIYICIYSTRTYSRREESVRPEKREKVFVSIKRKKERNKSVFFSRSLQIALSRDKRPGRRPLTSGEYLRDYLFLFSVEQTLFRATRAGSTFLLLQTRDINGP